MIFSFIIIGLEYILAVQARNVQEYELILRKFMTFGWGECCDISSGSFLNWFWGRLFKW